MGTFKMFFLAFCLILAVCSMAVIPANSEVGIEVYDANKQFLGLALGIVGEYAEIYMPSLKKVITIDYGTGLCRPVALFYETTDCTGIPYVLDAYSYIVGRGEGGYYTGERIAPTQLLSKSSYRIDS